ncbi:MAG: hypothetical protein HUK18_02225, partial [Bacteroidales bacterium]|nr:hypothetical protein [Bacteroidales bacterium]
MKKAIISLFVCFISLISFAQSKSQNIEIGKWRDHLSYYITHNVAKVDDRILVACGSSLFYFDPATKEMEKL